MLIWARSDEQREQIKQAGLELYPGELLLTAIGCDAEIEGVTMALLLTGDDHFNALGSMIL